MRSAEVDAQAQGFGRLLVSPWTQSFEEFAKSITRSALLVSPFITQRPLELLSNILISEKRSPYIEILTNLSVDNLIQGATQPLAVARLCRAIPTVSVWHLPGLHAKVYIADDERAVLTSANLTEAGLSKNYEYGIEIIDRRLVLQISEDVRAYAALGSEVSVLELEQLGKVSEELQQHYSKALRSTMSAVKHELEMRVEAARETLRHLRAKPGEPTTAIFARTILYLLRHGPLATPEIHPLVQDMHPDLCDDTIDRVINRVHFGKWWKHMVRNAQQRLKKQDLISLEGGKWQLASK